MFQTKSDILFLAPVSAPVVRIVGTSPTSVHISWIPLPNEKARGSIVAYKVQWRSHGHATANVEEVAADVLDYTIIGQEYNKFINRRDFFFIKCSIFYFILK